MTELFPLILSCVLAALVGAATAWVIQNERHRRRYAGLLRSLTHAQTRWEAALHLAATKDTQLQAAKEELDTFRSSHPLAVGGASDV